MFLLVDGAVVHQCSCSFISSLLSLWAGRQRSRSWQADCSWVVAWVWTSPPPSRCVSVSVSVLGDSLTNLQTLLSACCQQSLSCLPFHPVCVCVLYRSLCLWFSGHHLIVDSHLQRNTHCHVLTKWKVPCGFSSASHLLDKLWMSLAVTFLQFLKSWHVWNVTKVWKFPQVRGRSHFTLSTGFLLQLCSANVGQTDFL